MIKRLSTLARLAGGASLACCMLLPVAVNAGGLSVLPLRIDFAERQSAAQIELANIGGDDLAVQVSAVRWTQDAQGRDVYEPTSDIFFAPPIVGLPSGKSKSIRFRLRGAVDPTRELAYRLYFQELPAAGAAARAGTDFRLRLGVPVFVSPKRIARPQPTFAVTSEGDHLVVAVQNQGSVHLKISAISLYPRDVDRTRPTGELAQINQSDAGGAYLLPGSAGRWTLHPAKPLSPGRFSVLVRTDFYDQGPAAVVDASGWKWLDASLDPMPAP